ncbi:MAG: hypothetical protein ACTSXZ_11530 [Alphaproteobacteria bacterium]
MIQSAIAARLERPAGITIAAGSDAGNIGAPHGPSPHRELELMAAAGLTPTRVIVADIRNTRRIHRVVKGGEFFDPAEIMESARKNRPRRRRRTYTTASSRIGALAAIRA